MASALIMVNTLLDAVPMVAADNEVWHGTWDATVDVIMGVLLGVAPVGQSGPSEGVPSVSQQTQ